MPRGVRKNKPEPVKSDPLETKRPTGPVGHPISVGVPNMGKIQPPAKSEALCKCNHEEKVHYGPHTNWCNTDKCECQRFNEK